MPRAETSMANEQSISERLPCRRCPRSSPAGLRSRSLELLSISDPRRTDIGLFAKAKATRRASSIDKKAWQRKSGASRWVPSSQQDVTVGHRRDERRWVDMLDHNLSRIPNQVTKPSCGASLVTQQRASLSHAFEREEGVVWTGWNIHRQQLI